MFFRRELGDLKKQSQDDKNIITGLRRDLAGASAKLSDMTGEGAYIIQPWLSNFSLGKVFCSIVKYIYKKRQHLSCFQSLGEVDDLR